MRYWLIVPAAGAGTRFGAVTPKQYSPLVGRTMIEWALAPFLGDARCAQIVVAVSAGDALWPPIAERCGARGAAILSAAGGAERSLSVRSALTSLAAQARADDWVLVHDAARPCLTRTDLERLLHGLEQEPVGGLLAARCADTLKRAAAAAAGTRSAETVDRSALWRALTPQMFRYAALCAALDAAHARGRFPTDEAQALEWQGAQPLLIEGQASNLKVTTADELRLAAAILQARAAAAESQS
jgi:2-C-methyl-D-erythritol 4-phosphate cytidylyltransferase